MTLGRSPGQSRVRLGNRSRSRCRSPASSSRPLCRQGRRGRDDRFAGRLRDRRPARAGHIQPDLHRARLSVADRHERGGHRSRVDVRVGIPQSAAGDCVWHRHRPGRRAALWNDGRGGAGRRGLPDGLHLRSETFSGPTGSYSLSISPGGYELEAMDSGVTYPEGSVQVNAGGASTVDVQLSAAEVPLGTTAHNAARDVRYLNAQRAASGLPAGIELNPRWSQECAASRRLRARQRCPDPPGEPEAEGRLRGRCVGRFAQRAGRRARLDPGSPALVNGTDPPDPAVHTQPQRDRHR